MAALSVCSNDRVISAHTGRNSFRVWRGNASKRPELAFAENESFSFTSECCLFPSHHSKGLIKVTCWLRLAFLIFLVWVLLYQVFWENTRYYLTAVLLYWQNLLCFHILKEKGDVVMSWGFITSCSAQVGLLVEHLWGKLQHHRWSLPCSLPPQYFHAGANTHRSDISVFPSVPASLSPPCYSISACAFPAPIPLHCAFRASGFINVYTISCCLMPSAAVYFLRRKHLLKCCFFLSRLQTIPAGPCWQGERPLELESPPQLSSSPCVFPRLLANSIVFVMENHKLKLVCCLLNLEYSRKLNACLQEHVFVVLHVAFF